MAVQSDEKNTPPGTTMGDALSRAQAQRSQPQAQAATPNRPAARSGNDLNALLRRPMARKQSGEAVKALVAAITKTLDASLNEEVRGDFKVFTMDNNTNMIALSVILLTLSTNHNGQQYTAVYTYIVEGSGSRLAPRTYQIGNQSVEIDTVAGDVANAALWAKIEQFLIESSGTKSNLIFAGNLVLPTELSADDQPRIHNVTYVAVQALHTVTETTVLGNSEALSVSMIDPNASLTAILDYNPPAVETATGLPVRSNLSVTLRSILNNQGANLGYHEQARDITVTDGFVDLVFSPPAPPAYGQQPTTQTYYARRVITRLDSEVNAMTPELALLALGTDMVVNRDIAWGGQFLPRYTAPNFLDMRDIGAIGYETNFAGAPNPVFDRIDTKANDFGKAELQALIKLAVHQNALFSMDIDETGELSWLHTTFLAAANGNPEAIRSIIEAADRLTDGAFSRTGFNGAITHDDNNRVHLGYYTGQDGQLHDLRDIDYLAVLNLQGADDMDTVINWQRTYDDLSVPLEMRLESRAKILKAILADAKPQFKGYARRVTFMPEFLAALQIALHNAGLTVRPTNMIMDYTGAVGRGNYNPGSFALAGGQAGVFNYSTGPSYAGHRGIGAPFMGGRYGGGV